MREGVGHDIAARRVLDAVVAHGAGGLQPFLDVTLLEDALAVL